MALMLKLEVALDIQGEFVWLTDKTGAYDASSNDGGYGSPNEELANGGLVFYVVRNEDPILVLEPTVPGADVFHDNSAANDDETTVQFTLDEDGWYTLNLFYLPVTTDGVTYLNGNPVNDQDYFIQDISGLTVRQQQGASSVVITDYELLKNDINVVQVNCEDLLYPDLSIQKHRLYQEYAVTRDTQCDDPNKLLRRSSKLLEDLAGAEYAFRGGRTSEAHAVIDQLLKEQGIT